MVQALPVLLLFRSSFKPAIRCSGGRARMLPRSCLPPLVPVSIGAMVKILTACRVECG